ncbi:AAA family ATPase [Burkholderia sp. LAS2]|uniref:ATP-dependent nuclease n=1 Tax=Burkholderia sp. LAS2 TaxID=2813843 RepID=UPI001BD098C2|nr:AAA family ATPase [Burkholderia sp. LAS2]QVN12033.1 AAA family ATPase [Burkholderia sp. LAS2]
MSAIKSDAKVWQHCGHRDSGLLRLRAPLFPHLTAVATGTPAPMIKTITFKAGAAPNSPPLSIDLSPVTILVGPNNSGKSLALREIEQWCHSARRLVGNVIDSVKFGPWTEQDLDAFLAEHSIGTEDGETYKIARSTTAGSIGGQLHRQSALSEIANGLDYRGHMLQAFQFLTTRLDGRNRLALIEDAEDPDFTQKAKYPIGVLFRDDSLRATVRQMIYQAFGRHLVIDPTKAGHLRYRLSDVAPADGEEERGWGERSVNFHSAATPIAGPSASDGVKAYTGILTSLMAGKPRITLIDEPEAFLHPSLSHQLGKDVCTHLATESQRVIVSTHSAHFLMGCVAGSSAVNIVRLTYANEAATARVLPHDKLKPMLRNPLLRSIGVLSALFHNTVVVTEADADRAFYQEINQRLLNARDPRGIENCIFLNAQNKQTVWSIVKPLRELGIPAVGIVDLDVLKEGGTVWAKPMDGAFVPQPSRSAHEVTRSRLLDAFKRLPNYNDKTMKRDGGIAQLDAENRQAADDFFDQLDTYGIFVVRAGELERWLPTIEVERSKETWLRGIFEAMGEDPADPNYIVPAQGDVWDFIGKINAWLSNSSRRGMPQIGSTTTAKASIDSAIA